MAYASVTSLLQTMEQILHADGHEILDKKLQIEYLIEKFYFLLSFLQDCCSGNSSQAVKSLEVQIRDAAYKAEDILESYGSDQFLSESSRTGFTNFMRQLISAVKNLMLALRENILILDGDQSFFRRLISAVKNLILAVRENILILDGDQSFIRRMILAVQNLVADHWNQNLGWEYQLQKLLKEIDAITQKATKMKSSPNDLLLKNSVPDGSLRAASSGKRTLIGFYNHLRQIKDHLTGSSSKLKVVSIVGMGGIGKTTLTRNVYDDPLIAYHFHTRAWVTVSAQYQVEDILIDILNSMMVSTDGISRENTEELEDLLYKSLKGLRYLIVMDDVWESRAWDCVKRLFPDDNKGSRIMLTTRLLHVALYPENCSSLHRLPFLNENESWNLLHDKVFDGEYCHPELEKVGYKIAQNCQGLPIAIVIIAGLLSKVKKVQYWENVAENVSSIVTKNEEKFREILALSYSHLPHHLKACFLYMGVFPEDSEIHATKLINLWAAEGFIKLRKEKCLEEVGEEYLQNLVDRSLILVSRRSFSGKIKTCCVHDLLRDLCVRQAHEENFLYVARSHTDLRKSTKTKRRLSIHPDALYWHETHDSMKSIPLIRSLLCTGTHLYNYLPPVFIGFRLMRVLDVVVIHFYEFPGEIIELSNLRYLGFTYGGQLPKSISKLLNLETIVHQNWTFSQCPSLPEEIWMMPRLRHLYLTPNCLPDPPVALFKGNTSCLLEHLQTLSEVRGFICKKHILEKMPNLKKLEISYDPVSIRKRWPYYHLENLVNLHNLETLKFIVNDPPMCRDIPPPKLAFPPKLKSLTLSGCRIPWKDMTIVGSLPNLEVLKLQNYAFQGPEWEPIEGEFCKLKFLLIEKTDLEQWIADCTHFPRLQSLILKECFKLEDVPSGIGEIPTLNIIELIDCLHSIVTSAKQIQEEQECFGNNTLEVRVYPRRIFKDKFHTRILH